MTEKPLSLLPRLATALLSGASARARKRGLAFSLTARDLERMWVASKGCCAVSGIPFSGKRVDEALVKHPFHPSLDRIRPREGYTAGNTRLVCVAANFAMNEWGLEVLAEIADGIVNSRSKRALDGSTDARTADQDWSSDQRRKIDEAERAAVGLSGEELRKQRYRIAALRRNLTLGRAGMARAGDKAALARQAAKQEWIDLRRRLIERAEEAARDLVGPELAKQGAGSRPSKGLLRLVVPGSVVLAGVPRLPVREGKSNPFAPERSTLLRGTRLRARTRPARLRDSHEFLSPINSLAGDWDR